MIRYDRLSSNQQRFKWTCGLQSPDVNKPAFQIFKEERNLILQKKCPLCKETIIPKEFSDIERKEYSISGMCKTCQNCEFNEEETADVEYS